MDAHIVPGNVRDTALRLDSRGKPLLTAMSGDVHHSVLLAPGWLLPLAAWFAGEAQPVALGDRPGTLYGRTLDVRGDGDALVWNTHTWARLDCLLPYGSARVRIGPRGRDTCTAVMLSPEARQDVAAWLRRAAAEGWATQAATT